MHTNNSEVCAAPQRRLFFSKLCARVTVAATYAAVMRLDGTPLDARHLSSVANHVPDDPTFALSSMISVL